MKYGRSYRHVINYWAVSPIWRIHRAWLKNRTTFNFCPTLLTTVTVFRLPSPQYLLTYWLTVTYLLTHSTQRSPSSEANRFSASQEIPSILWNPKFHYRIHKRMPPVPILSQIDPVLILSSHVGLGLPSGLFPSSFPTKTLYTSLLSPVPLTCSANLILFQFYQPNNIGRGEQIIKLLSM